jgi:hypothetical protein
MQLSETILPEEQNQFEIIQERVGFHLRSGWFVCFDHSIESPLVVSGPKMMDHLKKMHGSCNLTDPNVTLCLPDVYVPGVPIVDGFTCKSCGSVSGYRVRV